MTIPAFVPLLLAVQQGKDDSGNGLEPPPFDFWSSFINMVAILAVVVGLLVLVAWLMRKLTGGVTGSTGRNLKLLESVPLGDRKFISLLKAGKRYFVVGITGNEVSRIAELDREDIRLPEEPAGRPAESGFAAMLRRFTGGAERE